MADNLIVIGIDSFDPYVISEYRSVLPNISSLITESPTLISTSIFPADTIPAWMSIFTGLRPGNHGVLYVYDIFDDKLSDLEKIDTSNIIGNTFWDYASIEGIKPAVVFPVLMYPTWEIDGIMISKSPSERRINWLSTERDVEGHPSYILDKYNIPQKSIEVWGGFPGINHIEDWININKQGIMSDFQTVLKIFENEKWDLFFGYFSLDIIQHRLWRYFDRNDPTYQESDRLGKIILDHYVLMDEIIGNLIENKPDTPMIIISDHGHKSRPYRTVNMNEFLRIHDYLTLKRQNKNDIILKKLQKLVLRISSKLGIEHFLLRLISMNGKVTSYAKKAYSSIEIIDNSQSKARLSEFAGMKSYSYGGIEILNENITISEYDRIVDDIINYLTIIEDPTTHEPIFNWVKKRKELDEGKYTDTIFPDIVFELKSEFAVGWDIQSGLIGKSYDHNIASGGHRNEGVILMRNIDSNIQSGEVKLTDIAPTILDILNLDLRRYNFDGKSIIEN